MISSAVDKGEVESTLDIARSACLPSFVIFFAHAKNAREREGVE